MGYSREYAKQCVGNGWHGLVDELFDLAEKEDFTVTDVKEKFGTLRIYADFLSEKADKLLQDLENRSHTMCECCGQPAEQRTKGGWVKTICIPCEEINRVLAKA